MYKNIVFTWISILLFNTVVLSQKIKTIHQYTTDISATLFLGIDNFQNLYYTNGNVFYKKSSSAVLNYQNLSLGELSHIDIINPLQLVLYYNQQNTVVFLDNQLNEIKSINISEINPALNISFIGLSSQNKIWLFDQSTQKILLLDYLTNIIEELPIPIEQNPKYIQSNFNSLYWIDELNNWYTTNIFGYKSLIANLPSFDKINILNSNSVLFTNANKMYYLNISKDAAIEIDIVENSLDNYYYNHQILAIFTNQQLKLFKLTLP
jgi:hypothetical protein